MLLAAVGTSACSLLGGIDGNEYVRGTSASAGGGGTAGAGPGGAGAGGGGGFLGVGAVVLETSGIGTVDVNDMTFFGEHVVVVGTVLGDLALRSDSGVLQCMPLGDARAGRDWFVLDLDAAGKPTWCVIIGGPGDDDAYAVATSAMRERIFVGGRCGDVTGVIPATTIATTPNACVIELTPGGGSAQKAAWFGTNAGENAVTALAVIDDELVAVGHYNMQLSLFGFHSVGPDWDTCGDENVMTVGPNTQPFVVRAALAGSSCIVSPLSAPSAFVEPRAIAGTSTDDLFVAGQFFGSFTHQSGTLTSDGKDAFAANVQFGTTQYAVANAAAIGGSDIDDGTAVGVLDGTLAVAANLVGAPSILSCPDLNSDNRGAVLALYGAATLACNGGAELASQSTSPAPPGPPPHVHDLVWEPAGLVVVGDITNYADMFGTDPTRILRNTTQGYVMFLEYDSPTMQLSSGRDTLFFGSEGTVTSVTAVARAEGIVAFAGRYTGNSTAGNGEPCPGMSCGFIGFSH